MNQIDPWVASFSSITIIGKTIVIEGLVMPDLQPVVIEVPIMTVSKAVAAHNRGMVEKMPVELIRTAKNRSKIRPDASSVKAPRKRGAKLK